jgi:hypothetical protein
MPTKAAALYEVACYFSCHSSLTRSLTPAFCHLKSIHNCQFFSIANLGMALSSDPRHCGFGFRRDASVACVCVGFYIQFFWYTQAVISDTQIRKRGSDIALQRFYLKMMHSHVHFAKKVIFLPRYADTHTK